MSRSPRSSAGPAWDSVPRPAAIRNWTPIPILILAACLVLPAPAGAALDLSRVVRERLDNGVTVLVLEEHALPLVSVQMLYKAGASDEVTGRTGLAHFVEHMAFRATENFPNTDVVSRIYAVGGEWHGYTWIDQTTYFETVPSGELDLVLDIEADRMARLLLPADEVEAERGAVLAELYGYQNDPSTVLKDAVLATSFLHHPYRFNTIGWPSDVERLTHADVEAFYRTHYRPANAVLAIVGDVETETALAAVRERFGGLPGGEPTPPPRTVEPPQRGERRVTLRLERGAGLFEVAYRAPAVSSPDYAAFLLLQELLGGSGGVNFLQDTFGTGADPSMLFGENAGDLVTWFPPSAHPYVLTLAGDRGARTAAQVERTIERGLSSLRDGPSHLLEAAVDSLREALVFDLETTEDAAHLLAYFEGLDALDVLLELPERIERVTAEEIQRVAARYLQPWQRTIGWIEAGYGNSEETPPAARPAEAGGADGSGAVETPAAREAGDDERGEPRSTGPSEVDPPITFQLSNGMPVLFQRSTLSPSGYLLELFPRTTCVWGGGANDVPVWRHASDATKFMTRDDWRASPDSERVFGGNPHKLRACAAAATREPSAAPAEPAGPPSHPDDALSAAFAELLGLDTGALPGTTPRLIVLTGDLDPAEARRLTERTFGGFAPATPKPAPPPRLTATEKRIEIGGLAQARLGWAVPAPPPADPAADAWRMLLYILTHDYEGRLGVEAISRRGLVYYIGSEYHCDGDAAWISLDTGVDPAKLPAMRALLEETLAGLETRPPTAAELEEARNHLIGRRVTAAQSNRELAERLARDAICLGGPLSVDAYRQRLERVGLEELRAAVPAFINGAIVEIE